jgi:hypothetical protein
MPEEQTSSTWLEHWGTLIVAIAALIQPWIAYLYRRFFKPPFVRIFEAGKIEIGYSGFGPTLGLNGTLNVENKDVFVRAIDLKLVRESDHSTHNYEWSLFRSNKVRLSQPSDMEFELASGLMLSTSQPHRFNILFIENKAQQELVAEVQKLQKAWNEFLWPKLQAKMQASPSVPADQYRLAIYEEFSKTPLHVETWSKVDRARYWEAGSYSLTMTVKTSHPEKCFTSTWHFSIDDSNATLLSFNSNEIVRTACNAGTGIWNFAYCVYEKGVTPAHKTANDDAGNVTV